MLVDSIEISIKKNDAIKHMFRKTPLISKINQFNRKIENIQLSYVEFKILKYEIIIKRKNKNNFRNEEVKHNITMIVNTYNGHSQSIDSLPETVKKYIAKGCIKKSNIQEFYLIEKVKNEIINHFENRGIASSCDMKNIKSIKLLDVKSIYKPYWIGLYNGKEVFIDA